MLGKVKSVVSKAIGGVKNVASKALGYLGNQTASAIGAFTGPLSPTQQTYNPGPKPGLEIYENKNTPQGTVSYGVNNPNIISGGKTYYAAQNPGSAGSAAFNQSMASPIYSAPVTLMGGQKPSGSSTTSVGGQNTVSALSFAPQSIGGESQSISATSLSAPSTPISVPSAPAYSNPGQINNGGLISALNSAGYQYNPETNSFTFTSPQQEQGQQDQEKRNKVFQGLWDMMPKKENVYDSPEIKAQQEEVRRRQAEVANYTAQLNSVVAQQNADLLRLRGVGSQEGVTETVYGGQAATINREAAIKALPIQAQVSAAQGNLGLAQDFLTQLTTWKTEQINNDYTYKKSIYDALTDYVKGEDKRKLDELKTKNDRAWEVTKSNIDLQDDLMKEAIKSGQSGIISRINSVNPTSPNFRAEIAQAAGSLASVNSSSGVIGADAPLYNGLKSPTATAVRGIVSTFKSEPAVTNFVQVQEGRNFAKSLSNSTKNPADDQALIYALAKVLDPGSVVREGEYATAQKYAQSWVQAYGKSISQALNGTGFLSSTARQNIKSTIETKFSSSKKSYDTTYNGYAKQINSLTGRQDGKEFLRDYTTEEQATNDDPLGLGITPVNSNPLGI